MYILNKRLFSETFTNEWQQMYDSVSEKQRSALLKHVIQTPVIVANPFLYIPFRFDYYSHCSIKILYGYPKSSIVVGSQTEL